MDKITTLDESKGKVYKPELIDAQKRYKEDNTQLTQKLEETYDFINVNIDPIMTKAIEKLLINKPENVADFLANYMRGTIIIGDYEKSKLGRQQYFDRKVRHLLSLASQSVIQDKPTDIHAYLIHFFEEKIKFY